MVKGTKVNEMTVGGVTISIWTATDPPKNHHDLFQVDVGSDGDDDWVCIGGGGKVEPGRVDGESFLVASFPSMDENMEPDWKGWVVSSRDHITPHVAPLEVFALGIKFPKLSKENLKSNLRVFKNESASDPHPETSSFVDNGFLLLGGGFHVLDQPPGGGNIGTGSFPDSNISWHARSKDHEIPSPSRIMSFAIGIRPTIRKFNGTKVGTAITSFHSFENLESDSSSVSPLPGMALCGMGGASHYGLHGTYLIGIVPELLPVENPTHQFVTVRRLRIWGAHGDHREYCSPTAYAMGVRYTALPFDPPILSCDKEIRASEADSSGHQSIFDALKAIDTKPETKWMSTNIPKPWIRLTLPNQKSICRIDITWANVKAYIFNISTSVDGNTFDDVYPEFITRTGTGTTEPESYYFTPTEATDIKLTFDQIGPFGTVAEIKEVKIFTRQG
jgi:hypothetical protein